MPIQDELRYLLEKHLEGRLTVKERIRFIYLLRQSQNRHLLENDIEDILHQHRYQDTSGLDKQALFEQVLYEANNANTAPSPTPVIPLYKKWRTWAPYAAAILILFITGTWYFTKLTTENQHSVAQLTTLQADTQMMASKVMLTLADGTQVAVDEVNNGNIDNKLGAHISKQPGVIVFNSSSTTPANTREAYNTITTARGKQYHIILPDKTEVWLNAASSLKFPLVFTGKERKVELTGEGYFEVASLPLSLPTSRDKLSGGGGKKPFIVTANGINVRVLGTHFNVMAYNNEGAVKTTLLEGSVQLNQDKAHIILKPGEQGSVTNNASFTITKPNLEQIMAWKNGEFRFMDSKIETIMRQVERWYDLDVVYKGEIPADLALSGVIARTEKVTQLLDILEATHRVRFSMEGNKVIVMPYPKK